jgi:hypothetical protein
MQELAQLGEFPTFVHRVEFGGNCKPVKINEFSAS